MHHNSRLEIALHVSERTVQTVQMFVVVVYVTRMQCDQVILSRNQLWEGKKDVLATWEAAPVWQHLLPQNIGSHR